MIDYATADAEVRPSMKRGINYNPYEHAAALDIPVLFRSIKANGLWVPERATIVLRSGTADWASRVTLAHEIAHAVLAHKGGDDPTEEWEANRYAGELLLTTRDVSLALSRTPNVMAAARRLKTTPSILRDSFTPVGVGKLEDDPWLVGAG